MAGDYALVSEKEISSLKSDMDYLKKNPLGGTSAGKSLQEDIGKLNKAIGDLVGIFREASDQMKLEDKETDIVAKKIDPLFEKIDILIEQNQKIAKGIVAVADMVAEHLPRVAAAPAPKPMPPQRPMQPYMPRVAPPPMPPSAPRLPPPPSSFRPSEDEEMSGGLPPLTPPPPKKESKGLFGGFMSK